MTREEKIKKIKDFTTVEGMSNIKPINTSLGVGDTLVNCGLCTMIDGDMVFVGFYEGDDSMVLNDNDIDLAYKALVEHAVEIYTMAL